MRIHERAAQIWPVLTLAARNRQVLTYDLLGKLIGVPRQGLGRLLEPIQSYCMVRALPPLTILVVSEETGIPGTGFIAAADIPRTQVEVFGHNWLSGDVPTPDDLEQAVKQQPSNGVGRPEPSESPTLQSLLDQITDENIHGEVDTGPAVGKEIW
jgi:hypothetical protein